VWRVSLRDRGARATGCPFCAGTRVTPEGSLAASHPELAAEWDTERNSPADPAAVAARSHSAVWWRCAAGHCWRARIGDRTTRGSGCPTCQDRTVTERSALAATAPALAAEWDIEKNGQLTAWSVRPFSNQHVWWRCPSGHCWRARISQRSIAHTGCPVCASSSRHGQLLTSTRPDVAAQWSEVLNGGGPGVVTSGSHVKAWWCCPADPSHLWCAAVRDRLRADTGCPYCTHKLPTPATSLAGAAPHLLRDWHPTRNTTVSPTDLLAQSATPVWWRCAEHHEWRSTPANRFAGRGCPDCAAQRHRRNLLAPAAEPGAADRDAAGHRVG